jgi:hypothetical protein
MENYLIQPILKIDYYRKMVHTNIMVRKIAVLLLVFTGSSGLFAQGENLTVKIAIVGPGDELYFWWGHIALIIEDSRSGRSYFYDYGLFSFDNENFFYNFAFGRLLYSCGVSPTESNINIYTKTNRDFVLYTLDLPPETRQEVWDFAAYNVLPENRDYFYHHFKDNCSTRIRDIIDLATGGQLKEKFENEVSRFTLRQHVRRHTWFSPVADWFLSFLMGQVIDTPMTVWEDMFLPSEVADTIENFYYTDINGERRKLVSSKEVLFTAEDRPPVLEKPRMQWLFQLIFSLGLSFVFGFFFYLYSKNIRAGRVLAGISMSFCGLVFGFVSLLLFFMALFTNHDYTFENANMIFSTPLLLAAVPLGISYAFTKKQKKLFICDQLLRLIWILSVLGIFISMVIKILPWFYQDNLTDQMLMLPIALIFACQPVGLKEVLKKWGYRGS